MPPKSLRSRACAQCRERRVKCDETPEICNQCRRLGLPCSGPIVGSIIIDMTERLAKPRGRKKKEAARATTAPRRGPRDPPSTNEGPAKETHFSNQSPTLDMSEAKLLFPKLQGYAENVEKAITAIRYQYRPPMFQQPSNAVPEALDAAFISHYVELNKGTRTYAPEIQWLVHLPKFYSSTKKPAVRLSLRAVSMAFYGKLHNEPSILADSWRWYSVSLNVQRTSISRSMKRTIIPDEEEVLVPLILTLYEVYVGATSSGSMAHLAAAAEIMNMRGPNNCRSGAIWPLFKAIRNSDAHKSIIFNSPSVYSSPDWMTIPFVGMPTDAHQRLIDIELMIPRSTNLLEIQGTLRILFETPIPPGVDIKPCQELTSKLFADLRQWATLYPHLTRIPTGSPDPSASTIGLDVAYEDHKRPAQPDTFIALIASNFIATRLTLNMLIHKLETESPSPPLFTDGRHNHLEEAVECAEAILQGAAAIEAAQNPGFDLLRSISPVIRVACTAPTPELRDKAREMMQRWGAKIGGLASIFLRI